MKPPTITISVSIAGIRTSVSPETARHIALCIGMGRQELDVEDYLDYRAAQIQGLFENAATQGLKAQAMHP